MSSTKPFVTITEQPAGKSQRFRYLSEVDGARSVGSIPGVSSTAERRTYPTIRVHGHKGPFVVLLSLINPEDNLVHPHSITGSDPRYTCRNGVIFVISDEPEVVFKNIGILCVKGKTEKDVTSALKLRMQMNIDPFGAGFSHIEDHRKIIFTAVRLCFQVFLPGPNWTPADRLDLLKYTRSLAPIASDVVFDAKKLNDLKIVHVTYCAGPLTGGTEMTLLCDKYTGQNPEVVFEDGRGWTQTVTGKMYHKQLAIVFAAPPYQADPRSPDYLKVQVYLQQSTERGIVCSQPFPVEYLPKLPKGTPLQFPTQRPPNYIPNISAKGKGRGKSHAKRSDSCAMPSTGAASSQVPPFSPYQNIKMSPVSYQEYSPSADFSPYNEENQHANIMSRYETPNSNKINVFDNISISARNVNNVSEKSMLFNMNAIQANSMISSNTSMNIRGNKMIPNADVNVNTRLANLNLNPTIPSPSGANNATPKSYIFSARIPSGTKVKRSVSERNGDKPDSGELSLKRDRLMPSNAEALECDYAPAHSYNPFYAPNIQIQNEVALSSAACSPADDVSAILNELSPNSINSILQDILNIANRHEDCLVNSNISVNHNNMNFVQNNIDHNNIDFNDDEYDLHGHFAESSLSDVDRIVPLHVDNNVHVNLDGREQGIVLVDFESVIADELPRL